MQIALRRRHRSRVSASGGTRSKGAPFQSAVSSNLASQGDPTRQACKRRRARARGPLPDLVCNPRRPYCSWSAGSDSEHLWFGWVADKLQLLGAAEYDGELKFGRSQASQTPGSRRAYDSTRASRRRCAERTTVREPARRQDCAERTTVREPARRRIAPSVRQYASQPDARIAEEFRRRSGYSVETERARRRVARSVRLYASTPDAGIREGIDRKTLTF